MTDPGPDHARFDELAAGYVLYSLEADDEQLFLAHAQGCPHCQQALADYADVAEALADTAPPAEPSQQLGTRIMAAALGSNAREDPRGRLSAVPGTAGLGDPQPAPDAQAIPLRRRPRPRWLNVAAAAAAVVVIAGGTWAGIAASTSGSTPQPLAACGHPHACPEVVLTDAAHQAAARVTVAAGSAWLQPDGLPADDTADQIYVLWQVTAASTPLPVGSFDIRAGTHGPIRVGTLGASYHGTKAFVVSLERGRTIPAIPSNAVATGHPSA